LQGPFLKRPVAIGREAFGLYILDRRLMNEVKFGEFFVAKYPVCNKLFVTSSDSELSHNQASKELSFDIWHKRIGHVPTKRMKLLPIDFVSPNCDEDVTCDICPNS